MIAEHDDTQLMWRIARKDHEAFAAFLKAHVKAVNRFALRMMGDSMMAEDVTQESFLKLWQHAGDWQPQAQPKTWLLTIAYRLCVDQLRRRKPQVILEENTLPDPADSAVETIARTEQEKRVRGLLDTLPENQRAALYFFYYEDMGQREVAQAMGLTEAAVESLLYRGRKTLKERTSFRREMHDAA